MNLLVRAKITVLGLCLCLGTGFLSVGFAAEARPAPAAAAVARPVENAEPSAYIHYGQMERWQEDNLQITAFTNKIELYQAGKILKAETLIARNKTAKDSAENADKKNKNIIFDEVYAEGNVSILSGNDLITADRFYYNFTNDTGIIINFELRTTAPENASQQITIVFRADVAYQISKSTITAKNASVTTCPHGEPHYYFWVSSATFVHDETGKHIAIYNIVPYVSGIPLFYFPYYKKTLGDNSIIRSGRYAKSSRFGQDININLGFDIKKYLRNDKGEILKDKDGAYKSKGWGDLTLAENWYDQRGTASEPELNYKWTNYEGFFKGYYIHDKGPDPTLAYNRLLYGAVDQTPAAIAAADQQMARVSNQDRGRIHFFNRYSFDEHWRADLEINHISDRYFLPEYFNEEYKSEKPPESYAYLRYLNGNLGVVGVAQAPLNDFMTEWDYQPRVKSYLIDESFAPLGATPFLYYSGSLEAAQIKLHQDISDTSIAPYDTLTRVDSLNELSAPFQVGFIRFSPFVSGRWTEYDQTITSNKSDLRFVGSEGLRSFMQFSRTYDLKQKNLGLNTPMHIISFDVRYTDNSNVSIPSSNLIQTDNTDRYDKFGEWYFEIRNRFKNKVIANNTDTTVDQAPTYKEFLNIGLAIERYSKPISSPASNYLYPMSWQTIIPTTQAHDDFPVKDLSDLHLDVEFTPAAPYSLRADMQYNTDTRLMEFWTFNMNLKPYPNWTLSLDGSFMLNRTEAYTVGVTCSPIEKWELAISEQYDFWERTFLNKNYTLRRDMHEFFLEFTVSIDKSKGEKSFYIRVSPKGETEHKIGGL